jgi:hypothetical protein
MSFGIASSLLAVRFGPLGSAPFDAGIFLREVSAASRAPETLGSRLNEPGVRFLPISFDGRIEMIHLVAIGFVERIGELAEIDRLLELGVQRVPVAITLTDATVVHGDLLAMTRPEGDRLSDLLNHADRFVLVADRSRALYVRRDAILRVRSTALRGV